MFDEHKDKRKYNNFGYHSTKFWLKGNDKYYKKAFNSVKIIQCEKNKAEDYTFTLLAKRVDTNKK